MSSSKWWSFYLHLNVLSMIVDLKIFSQIKYATMEYDFHNLDDPCYIDN